MALTRRPSVSVEARDPNDEVFAWPHLLYRELLVALGVVVALHVVSLMFMAPLEEMADPTRTPNPAKAPWYFLGLQELVHYSALVGGVLVPDADRRGARWRCPTSTATRRGCGAGSRRSGASPTRSSPRSWPWRRPHDHRHALPRRQLGLGLAVVELPCVNRSAPPALHVAFAALGLGVPRDLLAGCSSRSRAPSGVGAGALPPARGDASRTRTSSRSRPASPACARSGCPTSAASIAARRATSASTTPRSRSAPAPFTTHPGHVADDAPRPIGSAARPATTARAQATDYAHAAHQPQPFVARPMRPLETIEANCGTCHRSLEPPDAPRLAEGRRLIAGVGLLQLPRHPGLRGDDASAARRSTASATRSGPTGWRAG